MKINRSFLFAISCSAAWISLVLSPWQTPADQVLSAVCSSQYPIYLSAFPERSLQPPLHMLIRLGRLASALIWDQINNRGKNNYLNAGFVLAMLKQMGYQQWQHFTFISHHLTFWKVFSKQSDPARAWNSLLIHWGEPPGGCKAVSLDYEALASSNITPHIGRVYKCFQVKLSSLDLHPSPDSYAPEGLLCNLYFAPTDRWLMGFTPCYICVLYSPFLTPTK